MSLFLAKSYGCAHTDAPAYTPCANMIAEGPDPSHALAHSVYELCVTRTRVKSGTTKTDCTSVVRVFHLFVILAVSL